MLRSHTLSFLLIAGSCAVALRGQDPAVDDFERHLLGANWATSAGAGIVANSDLGATTATSCFARWVGSTFRVDQYSETELSVAIPVPMLVQAFARWRSSDLARYGFHWNGDGALTRWEIKYDGVPTAQTRILASVDGPGPLPGDTLRIEVEGTDQVIIRGFHNGRLKLLAVDSAPQRITTTEGAGVVTRPRGGATVTPPVPVFERWTGGSLAWFDVGNGLAGTAGIPVLAGSGVLRTGASVTLDLTRGRAGSVAALALGLSRIDAPLLGGVLVPAPDLVVAPLALDGAGSARLVFPWPETSSGFSMWSQAWIVDPGGVQGAAASNAVLARVP